MRPQTFLQMPPLIFHSINLTLNNNANQTDVATFTGEELKGASDPNPDIR